MVMIFDCASGEELTCRVGGVEVQDSDALPPCYEIQPRLALHEIKSAEKENFPIHAVVKTDWF